MSNGLSAMSMRGVVLAFAAFLVPLSTSQAGGIGVLGDSYSDEYRFYAPHRSTARNWVEILAETKGVDFGPYSEESRGEPRNAGYAYNWAKSDASTEDMIASGQHEGLADQVRRGEVSIVVVFIGGNDAIHAMYAPSPSAAIKGLGRRASANVRTAVDTILAASPEVRVLIATVPDIRDLPEFRDPLNRGELERGPIDGASAELDVLNAEIRRMGREKRNRVGVLDLARITRVSNLLTPYSVVVSGRQIERARPGDEIDHLFLGDVRHLGTVGQGLFAKMFADALNARFHAGIAPLDEGEIMAFAEHVNPSLISAETTATAPAVTSARGD